LPFVDTLSERLTARVFAKHGGLFGRSYTTAIVLRAFMGQFLRDVREVSCQSAVARISCCVTTKPGRKQDPFIIVTTMPDADSDDAVQYEVRNASRA